MAKESSATIGFKGKLCLAADKQRNNMDEAEYNYVVLGLISLKYISDTFEEHLAKLLAGQGDYAGANAEDPDKYKAEGKNSGPAKCEVRSASVKVKTLRPFVIQNSSFYNSQAYFGEEHGDSFRHIQHPDLSANFAIEVSKAYG